MANCPYPRCNADFELEYSMGTCQKCKHFILACSNCGGYNREFARFCWLCGKPLEYEKIQHVYYTRKFQKTSHLILNKFALKKLDFIEPGQTFGMPFIVFSGNRVIVTSPNGFLFDWDFVTRKQFNRMKIPDVEILVKPLVSKNIFFFASRNTIYLYNLLTLKIKDVKLKNDALSIISLVEWEDTVHGLFLDTQRHIHVFGKINTRSFELDELVEIDDQRFSPNVLSTNDAVFLFSTQAFYIYKKENGNVKLEIKNDFPKKSLNISAKLHFHPGGNVLYVPEETGIMRFNLKSGQFTNVINHLQGTYYTEFTGKRVIICDNNGLHISDYNGKPMVESKNESFMKNLSFNSQPYSMKLVSERLIFAFAFQNRGGGFLTPWMLDEPRVFSAISKIANSRIPHELTSNIDVSRNNLGLVTSGSEVIVWQF